MTFNTGFPDRGETPHEDAVPADQEGGGGEAAQDAPAGTDEANNFESRRAELRAKLAAVPEEDAAVDEDRMAREQARPRAQRGQAAEEVEAEEVQDAEDGQWLSFAEVLVRLHPGEDHPDFGLYKREQLPVACQGSGKNSVYDVTLCSPQEAVATYEALRAYRPNAQLSWRCAVNPRYGVKPGKAGGLKDITRLAGLYIDLDVDPEEDPDRPGWPKRCPDMDAIHDIIDDVSDYLGQRPTVLIFSGHGVHPIWAVDFESGSKIISSENRQELGAFLRRFRHLVEQVAESHGCQVDPAFDAARTFRIPGSFNWKDPNNPVEAYALADTGQPLTVDEIRAVFDECEVPEHPDRTTPTGTTRDGPYPTGMPLHPYVQAALDAECADLAEQGVGRNEALNEAAFTLGQFVGGGVLDEERAWHGLLAASERNGYIGKDGQDAAERTLCSGLEAGKKQPRGVPDEPARADVDVWTDHTALQGLGGELSDAYLALVAKKMLDQRAARDVRRLLDEEDAHRDLVARRDAFRSRLLGIRELDTILSKPPLIEGVLPRDSYGIVRGRDASFKSFITLDWSLSLATGRPWQGKATDQVKVLYVAAEGYSGLIRRRDAWETHHGLQAGDEWLEIYPEPVNLYRDRASVAALVEYVQEESFGLVVFDTLRRCSGGADGNGSDMGVVVDAMQEIRLATDGGTVLAVAHTGKTDDDTRGFSGIEDDADFVHSVKRDGVTLRTTLAVEKMKDGPDGHKFELSLLKVATGEETSLVVQPPGTRSIFDDIETNESDQVFMTTMLTHFRHTGTTMTELIAVSGLPKSTAYDAKSRLTSQGFLEAQTKRNQTKFYVDANHRRVRDYDAENLVGVAAEQARN
jgi:RecA-family ATPase